MEDDVFYTLRRAVALAKERQLRSVDALKAALRQEGHDATSVDRAVEAWAAYERSKPSRA